MIRDFYGEFLDVTILQGIKEDLLEYAYHSLMNKGIYSIVFTLLKIETLDSDQILVKNYQKFEDVRPENIGIDPYFTLNAKSPFLQEF